MSFFSKKEQKKNKLDDTSMDDDLDFDFSSMDDEFSIDENNTRKSGIQELSKANSKVKVFKIPTQEEYMIAKEAKAILEK